MKYIGPVKISRNKKYMKTPYWNIYRAVFAGWLIRYPRNILRYILILIFLLWIAPLPWKFLIIFLTLLIIIDKKRR